MGARARSTALLFVLALASAAGAQEVWVVDDGGGAGVDFTQIQPAVDAAADGDVILVRPGSYGAVVVDGRSLSIVGDDGALPLVRSLSIRHVPVGGAGVVRRLVASPPPGATGVALEDDAGVVWLEDVLAVGAPALRVRGAQIDVAAIRCLFRGVAGALPGPAPGAGMVVEPLGAAVVLNLQDTRCVGGKGASSAPTSFVAGQDGGMGFDGGDAGDSIELVAIGTEFVGGAGGAGHEVFDPLDPTGPPIGCASGGDGGDGFFLHGDLVGLDDVFVAGLGGAAPRGCSAGLDGAAGGIVGSSAMLPGPFRALSLDAPVREGAPLRIDVVGVPGDVAFLAVSPAPDPHFVEGYGTFLLSHAGMSVHHIGMVGASGTLSVTVPAPSIHSGAEGIVLVTQGYVLAAFGGEHLMNGSALVLLDASL